jgi:Mg-chelatase subunit ChlD/tetratricopeptide (TPR) repeat protein
MTIHRPALSAGIIIGFSLLGPAIVAQDSVQPELSIEPGLSARRMNTDARRITATREAGRSSVGNAAIGRLSIPGDRSGLNKVLGLKSFEVNAEIEGMAARTTIKHVFENDTDSVLEGVFTFPLPESAAVDRFAMTIHGESDYMEGTLVENKQAHNIYNSIVYGSEINRDPGVLEWIGANTFRATIFPIESHRTKTIIVSYLQPLQLSVQDGYEQLSYRFPLSNARDLPPALRMKLSATLFGLHRDAEIGASLNPTLTRDKDNNAVLTSEAAGDAPLDKDWIVTVDPPARAANSHGLIVQAHRPDVKNDGRFALTVTPDCGTETAQSLDAIIMVNTSARRTSAEFEKMRAFVKATLLGLTARDRFAVVPFDITARPMPGGLLAVNDENIQKACDYLKAIQTMGATDIAGAFQTVRSTYENAVQRHVSLVYIGDSEATFGRLDQGILQKSIDEVLKSMNAEMYPVLTRSASGPDAINLRERLNQQMQNFCGANVIDLSGCNPDVAGRDLAARLGTPMLRYARLKVSLEDGSEPELISPVGEGLYLQQATSFFGTYSKSGPATVVLTGRCKGKEFRQQWSIELPEKEEANAAVTKLWAHSRITYAQAHPGERGTESALKLALEHHVLSKLTAFLVLENEEMYRQFQVQHNKAVPDEKELRARFMAGSGDADDVSAAVEKTDDEAGTTIGVRLTTGLKLCSPMLTTVQVGGVDVEVSLQSAKVKAYQTRRSWPLLRLEQVQVRLGISRLLAAERGLPFEPETVYPELWLKALEKTPEQLLSTFNPDADDSIWQIVQTQPITTQPSVKPSWASALNDVKIFDEAEALVNPDKLSTVTFSADGTQMQLNSHLFAHLLFNRLMGNSSAVTFDPRPWMNEIRRVIITRRSTVYPLTGISSERLAAAYNFLSQVALVEGQGKLAGELSTRAIDAMKSDAARHTLRSAYLARGLAAELHCDYKTASESFQKMLEKSSAPLIKTGKELTYQSLISTMSLAGNTDGAIAVMERWRADEGQRSPLTLDLAKAYLNGGRTNDAIRAISSDADFDVNIGKHFEKPEDFLTLLIGK